MKRIEEVAKKIDLNRDDLILYGDYKAKIKEEVLNRLNNKENAKLVLVTAITPTKAGEGKTTTVIGLNDALNKLDKKSICFLREPSMGPTFGLKGGATGGGMSSVVPKKDINLHFTGDMHALTSSINLISAIIDNHIYQGNELNIDKNRILWKRALDINDRELREVNIGLGKNGGIFRKEHFEITVASELMAIMCLAKDKEDFTNRINNILIAYSLDNKPIHLKELNITNAILSLMEEALLPNLVQSLSMNPVLIHGGPFANIAHGCASIIGTKYALKLADIVIEEAGFGSDLGAEKFLDIKCKEANLNPNAIVLVCSIRALKSHGGVSFEKLDKENILALKEGFANLKRHYEALKNFNLPIIIGINKFNSDSINEINTLKELLTLNKYNYSLFDAFNLGGEGCIDLAKKVLEELDKKEKELSFIYSEKEEITIKINKIAKKIYGASEVKFTKLAKKSLKSLKNMNVDSYYICIAKTPLSLSDDPKKINAPTNFIITIKDIYILNGARFIVCLLGDILTMPGLNKNPRAINFN